MRQRDRNQGNEPSSPGDLVFLISVLVIISAFFFMKRLQAPLFPTQGSFPESGDGPEAAKTKGLFWGVGNELFVKTGGPLDILGNPSYFSAVFPGYDVGMSRDKNLWRNYFSTEFHFGSYVNLLSQGAAGGTMITASWTGCFDIFEHYGADIILLGNSESYRGLVPDLLQTELMKQTPAGAPTWGPKPRILSCGEPNSVIETVMDTAEELKVRAPSKVKWTIWGPSYWAFYGDSPSFDGYYREQTGELDQFRARDKKRPWWARVYYGLKSDSMAHYFPTFSWKKLFPERNPAAYAPPSRINRFGIFQMPAAHQPDDVEALLASVKPGYSYLIGADARDCDLSAMNAKVDETVQTILKFSENLLIFVPPTTPVQTNYGPPCLLKAVRRLLESKAAPNVVVYTGDWRSFGLNYSDYVHPTDKKDFFQFQRNHCNFSGARKITLKIAQILKDRHVEATAP